MQALVKASSAKSLKPDQRALAKGYLSTLSQPTSSFLLSFLNNDLLSTMEALTKSFQTINTSLVSCLDTLGSVYLELEDHKATYTVEHIQSLINPPTPASTTQQDTAEQATSDDRPPSKRRRVLPSHLNDSVITSAMPIFRNPANDNIAMELRGLAVDVIESFKSELDGRFSNDNVELWGAFQSLSPTHSMDKFLDGDLLLPLLKYAHTIPVFRSKLGDLRHAEENLRAECRIFKKQFVKRYETFSDSDKLQFTEKFLLYCQELEAVEVLEVLFKIAVVAGYSTSTVEAAFSARTRIDGFHRRRMSPYKQGNLTVLHFEKKLTKAVTFEEFEAVWKSKPRRLRL